MFLIRVEQMHTLRESERLSFVDRVAQRLRSALPGTTRGVDHERLRYIVIKSCDRATGYGILLEWDIFRYVEMAVEHGLAFEDRPEFSWVRQVLGATGLDGREKMDIIEAGPGLGSQRVGGPYLPHSS